MVRVQRILSPWLERIVLAGGRLNAARGRTWVGARRWVFVCSGNICRSPYAEVAARAQGLPAISCGIATTPDLPADGMAMRVAALHGLDLGPHRTTRWEDVALQSGDVIVTMQLRHAHAVLPKARAAGCPVVMLSSFLPEFRAIWDPYGGTESEFQEIFDLIDSGVREIAGHFEPADDQEHYHHFHSGTRPRESGWKTVPRRVAKEVMGRAVVALGLHHRMLKGRAVVVAFHSVTNRRSNDALRCGVRDFRKYCEFFSRHLQPATFNEVVDKLERRLPLKGELSITFDDGYADNAEVALPILTRYRLHGTFFIATGFMGSDTQTAWDRKVRVRSRWMSWAQVQKLIDAGHEIGAHTTSHADLGVLSRDEAMNELCNSRDALFERTGQIPRHFALPFGRSFPSIDQTVQLVRDLGFESFSLCRGGLVHDGTSTMYIERWPVNPMEYLSPYGWFMDVLREAKAARST